MPADYINADFALINVVEATPSYPFAEMDDPTHVVWKLRCRQTRSAYAANVPALDTPMLADVSGITAAHMPVEDGDALFVGDVGHTHLPHGRIEFIRRFATFPADQTGRLVGSRSWPFPAYQSASAKTPENANDDLYRIVAQRTNNSNAAPVYKDIEYFLLSGDVPEIPAVFRPTIDGNEVDYVSDGGEGSFNGTALNGDSVNEAWSVAATSPSLTEYKAMLAAKDPLIIDVALEQYMGNIHRLVIWKMLTQ